MYFFIIQIRAGNKGIIIYNHKPNRRRLNKGEKGRTKSIIQSSYQNFTKYQKSKPEQNQNIVKKQKYSLKNILNIRKQYLLRKTHFNIK